MKNSIKKNAGLFLSLMLVPSMMTACSTSKSSAPAANASQANPNAAPATLTVEVFDRGKPGQAPLDNNYFTKYVNDNFGSKYNTTVKYVAVPRAQEVDKLNLLMASNQAPDICFTYDQNVVYKYVKSEGIIQLDNLLQQYGSNLTKYLSKDVLSYGTFGGKQMVIPAKRTILAGHGTWIRQDWLDKLGMKAPTNQDELYNTLVAFRDKNPGNVSGGVIPWAMGLPGSSSSYGFNLALSNAWTKMSDQDAATLSDWEKPGNKDGLKFLNKLYNEKLISPDFAVDKTGQQANADLSNGKGGFTEANFDYPIRNNPGIYDNLKKNVPGAVLTPIDTFKNYEGKYYKNEYNPNGIFIMIPKTSKNAVQAIQYLNWMSDSKVIFDMQNGKEGVNYKLIDGIPQSLPATGDMQINSSQNVDYEILTNGAELGDSEKNMKAVAMSYPGYETEAAKELKIAQTDTYRTFWFETPSDSNAKYSTTLADKTVEMQVKLISAKPADFDKLYDSLVQEYLEAGGKAVKEENIKIYNGMKAKK